MSAATTTDPVLVALAHDVFCADNHTMPPEVAEDDWADAHGNPESPVYVGYAYKIAEGLLAKGWQAPAEPEATDRTGGRVTEPALFRCPSCGMYKTAEHQMGGCR